LSGEAQGALMMQADWVGREVGTTTFTGALSIPSVEEILVNTAKLYIEHSGGSIGGTEVSDTLFAVDLSYTTGFAPFWAADGSKDFSFEKFTEDEIVLQLTYEHNASAVAEKAKYQAGTIRLIRLQFEGSDVTTAGTDYSKKTLILDFAGVYEEWSGLEEKDGSDVVTAILRCRYSSADSLKFQATAVNELSTLP